MRGSETETGSERLREFPLSTGQLARWLHCGTVPKCVGWLAATTCRLLAWRRAESRWTESVTSDLVKRNKSASSSFVCGFPDLSLQE